MKLLIPLLLSASLVASDPSIKSLYSSLDPKSLSQYMAFYELYSDTAEGKKALNHIWKLLRQNPKNEKLPQVLLPKFDIQTVVSLVTRQPFDPPVKLSSEQLSAIHELCSHFANRNLKGSEVWTKDEVIALPTEEVDLTRGLLIEQFEDSPTFRDDILQYEASLDLMALQIAARLSKEPTNLEKIKEINRYIFQEMQFRFPPHSLYAKDIDLYTFLPSVLDSRHGVCLGVSILYLCLAQRLDLPLEVITPPGHIYVRYHEADNIINIETTARGINTPNEAYLGLNTRKLQERTIKEVIGLAFANQAAVYWQKGEPSTCIKLYEKALPYVGDDPLISMFLGLNYLFVNRKEEGEKLLKPLIDYTFDYAVGPETLISDYFAKKTNPAAIQAIFIPVDETRESILKKQEELADFLKQYPHFRGGLLQLATTYLQLGRTGEAREILYKYHKIDPTDPTVEYYLSIVSAERLDFNQSWSYLKQAERLTELRDHKPAALRVLRNKLRTVCPDSG